MTPEQFAAAFDEFSVSAFRLETLQTYAVADEDARLRAFREGLPRPERSVRTSPWLRRVAVTTAAGKRWERVHILDEPLTEYLRYQLVGYIESAAAGEQIRIARRDSDPALVALPDDFWLFDAETSTATAIAMQYDSTGHLKNLERISGGPRLEQFHAARALTLARSVSLAEYLASHQAA